MTEETFGFVHLLAAAGSAGLAGHPELLKQLAAFEYEQTEWGLLKIAVPEARGHDDIAIALNEAELRLRLARIEIVRLLNDHPCAMWLGKRHFRTDDH